MLEGKMDMDRRRLLDGDLASEEGDNERTSTPHGVRSLRMNYWPWTFESPRNARDSCSVWRVRRLILVLACCILASSAFLFSHQSKPSSLVLSSESPFTGAFSIFPHVSALQQRQKRITLISMWNDDNFTPFLRHFLYTVQLNADYVDFVLVNRRTTADASCLDFEQEHVDITWAGNVRYYCLQNEEWQRRVADFLCSSDGWSCNSKEHGRVLREIEERQDKSNVWRPLWGFIYRDLFANPENPFWGWIDMDTFVGNFARYPFNVLSKLSLVTGTESIPELVYMAGQFTAFNLDDEALKTAWKRFPPLKTAKHFTEHIDGVMPQSTEEHYWSSGYLRSDQNSPGAELSYAIYPGIHGDDYYNRTFEFTDPTKTYIVSGRDILLIPSSYTREEIETLIRWERSEPIDDLGEIGWTGGEDGSAYLLDNPNLVSSEAKDLAISHSRCRTESNCVHQGLVEDVQLTLDSKNCHLNHDWAPEQCVTPPHPDTVSYPPLMRASYVHFKNQAANHLLRRLERDTRRRGYERKLIKHHLRTKRRDYGFPPFEITEDLVLKYNNFVVEVFRMGPMRNETLYLRKKGEQDIG